MKKNKIGNMISLVFIIILGIALVIFPGTALTTLIKIIGGAMALIGIIKIVAGLVVKEKNLPVYLQMVLSAVITVAGFIFLYSPDFIISLFPIFMGLTIALTGVLDLLTAIDSKNDAVPNWNIMLVLSLITIGFGILIFANPFSTMEFLIRIMGIALVYNGVSGIWIALHRKRI